MNNISKANNIVELSYTDPILTTWAANTFLLSTILTKSTALDWVYNNFLQIKGFKGHNKNGKLMAGFTFVPEMFPNSAHFIGNIWDLCPFIERYFIGRDIALLNYDNITDFLVKMLNMGYYTYLYLEQNLIRKEDAVHSCLIYGYEKADNFLMLDHLDYGKFTSRKYSFEVINESFIRADDYETDDMIEAMELGVINLFRMKDYDFKFDIGLFRYLLEKYLGSSREPVYMREIIWKNDSALFGISSYEVLMEYLSALEMEAAVPDFKIFTFMYDHKRVLSLSAEYLMNHKYLPDDLLIRTDLQKNAEQSKLALYKYIKYEFIRDNELIKNIAAIYENIRDTEIASLRRILNYLS